MRVVSLVPSATETLLALGVTPVACTRFCDQPGLQTVGGTKDPDVEAIVELMPDLVVVNDEENRREDAVALRAAGVTLHEMSPRSVADVAPAVRALASRLGVAAPATGISAPLARRGRAVAFVWRRPWMILTTATFGASMLEHLGWVAVATSGPDRYPEVTLADVAGWSPDLVVLPDEPYPFAVRHRNEIVAALPSADVRIVDGRDLFWWGTRTPDALARLAATLA